MAADVLSLAKAARVSNRTRRETGLPTRDQPCKRRRLEREAPPSNVSRNILWDRRGKARESEERDSNISLELTLSNINGNLSCK